MRKSQSNCLSSLLLNTNVDSIESPKNYNETPSYFISRALSNKSSLSFTNRLDNSQSKFSTRLDESFFDNFIFQDNTTNQKITQRQLKDQILQGKSSFNKLSTLLQTSNSSFSQKDHQKMMEVSIRKFQDQIITFRNKEQFWRIQQKAKKYQNAKDDQKNKSKYNLLQSFQQADGLTLKEAIDEKYKLEKEQLQNHIYNNQAIDPQVNQMKDFY